MPQPHSGAIIQSGIWEKITIGVEADLPLRSASNHASCIHAQRAKSVLLEVDDIVERHEMHAALIEGIPAPPVAPLAEALEIDAARLGSRMSCSPGA